MLIFIASEYSNKITIFNAKEKLLQHVRNMNVEKDQSNKWNFMINLEQVQNEEEENMKEIFAIVKEKEFNILKTEMIMQQKSIYSESYKPLFINEMDDEQIKEFSKVLSQKLRHVKLAISKANMGQNKYTDFNKNIDEKSQIESLGNNNHEPKKKKLQPIKAKPSQLAQYFQPQAKETTPNMIFENCKIELEKQISDLKRPFQLLIKKTKIKPINYKTLTNSEDSIVKTERKTKI